jgi:SAM-dependent methyltransferase
VSDGSYPWHRDTVAPTTEFDDPRLASVYDTLNGYAPGTQPDFYLGLARDLDAATVVEIGCGTGLITACFVRAGFDVIGLEPSGPMLQVARRRAEARCTLDPRRGDRARRAGC